MLRKPFQFFHLVNQLCLSEMKNVSNNFSDVIIYNLLTYNTLLLYNTPLKYYSFMIPTKCDGLLSPPQMHFDWNQQHLLNQQLFSQQMLAAQIGPASAIGAAGVSYLLPQPGDMTSTPQEEPPPAYQAEIGESHSNPMIIRGYICTYCTMYVL